MSKQHKNATIKKRPNSEYDKFEFILSTLENCQFDLMYHDKLKMLLYKIPNLISLP